MIPAHTTDEGGTTVVYGSSTTAPVLHVYADLRCPYCKRVEEELGGTMRQLADDGAFVLHFHFATFLDDRLGGDGSRLSLNALGAALDVGQREFMDYLAVLYAAQPPEERDDFADPETLLSLAARVAGLRSAAFDQAVPGLAHRDWVDAVSAAFLASGVGATPTVLMDDRPVGVLNGAGNAVSPEQFVAQLQG